MAAVKDLVRMTSPYVRHPKAKVERMMYDVIIALMPVTLFTIYKYGMVAVGILAAALISMVGTEFVWYKLRKEPFTLYNGTAIISALIYALIMPDAVPLWIVFVGGVAAMMIAKLPFGGMGANIFNIAGFGRVFIMLSFGALLTYDLTDTVAGATVLGQINGNLDIGQVTIPLWNLITGIGEAGSIGEENAIVILIGLVYLLVRRSTDWRLPLVYLLTFIGMSAVAGYFSGNILNYVLIHLFSGGILFGAVFMITDPISSPTTGPGRVYHAFGVGALTFFIRIFGAYPEGVVFAILIMDMFVPAFDYYKWSNPKFTVKSVSIFSLVVIATFALLVLGVR